MTSDTDAGRWVTIAFKRATTALRAIWSGLTAERPTPTDTRITTYCERCQKATLHNYDEYNARYRCRWCKR